jgi:UDP-glucose 4-epimerase
MKNACVIGGSGFLGSHVADALSKSGYSVKIFDLVESRWVRSDQIMCIGSILDDDALHAAIEGSEVVFNFAALADINAALYAPIPTVEVNVLGNVKILEACNDLKVGRYMYASSIYVHSAEGGFYRCSKQASESYVEEYQRTFGLNYTILRYGSLYGPRSNHSNGLYRIIKCALENSKIKYAGNVDAMREYIHVEDAANASVFAVGDAFCNQSIVLTGQEPMRVLDLLNMLSEMLGISEPVEFLDERQEGHYIRTPYSYQPKIGRKYIPPVHIDLGQGLLELIHEIRAQSLFGIDNS